MGYIMFSLVALLAFAFLPIALSQESIDGCPSNLSRDDYNLNVRGGICYQFVLNEHKTFVEAKQICDNNGGMLAVVQSAEINSYLVETLLQRYKYRWTVWIGLQDRQDEHKYYWEDGTILKTTGYNNWARGEGWNGAGLAHYLEDCVAMDLRDNGKWHDYECDPDDDPTDDFITAFSYICQYSTTNAM